MCNCTLWGWWCYSADFPSIPSSGFLFLQPWANTIVPMCWGYSCKMEIIFFSFHALQFFVAGTVLSWLFTATKAILTGPQHKQASQHPPHTSSLQKIHYKLMVHPPLLFLIKELAALEIFLQDHSPEQVKEEVAPGKVRCTPILSNLKLMSWPGSPPTPQQGLLLNHLSLDSPATLICFPAQKDSQNSSNSSVYCRTINHGSTP